MPARSAAGSKPLCKPVRDIPGGRDPDLGADISIYARLSVLASHQHFFVFEKNKNNITPHVGAH